MAKSIHQTQLWPNLKRSTAKEERERLGNESPNLKGRCSACEELDKLGEVPVEDRAGHQKDWAISSPATTTELEDMPTERVSRLATLSDELNRILGGVVVPGTEVVSKP